MPDHRVRRSEPPKDPGHGFCPSPPCASRGSHGKLWRQGAGWQCRPCRVTVASHQKVWRAIASAICGLITAGSPCPTSGSPRGRAPAAPDASASPFDKGRIGSPASRVSSAARPILAQWHEALVEDAGKVGRAPHGGLDIGPCPVRVERVARAGAEPPPPRRKVFAASSAGQSSLRRVAKCSGNAKGIWGSGPSSRPKGSAPIRFIDAPGQGGTGQPSDRWGRPATCPQPGLGSRP